uniref:Zinc finger GRF-type domain-containing protein n=1 Tax=Hordeum vulgare subsp. vulgare TaxID=112509 RepID=A0A8I6XAB8_HORVV
MSCLRSRATSRMQSPTRMDMSIFVCPQCQAGVYRRVSHTPKNHNRLFYVCGENGVKCFFLWVDALAKTLMNELQEEHEEWLPMLPRTAVAVAQAPKEETEGEARNERELAIELRMFKKKFRKLEDQVKTPICNYFWEFVGMVIALSVMLKLYGKT